MPEEQWIGPAGTFEPVPLVEELSPGVRLTGKRRAAVERGVHPATGVALLRVSNPGDARTCGDCGHLWRKDVGNGHWWKCTLAGAAGKDGPDITKRWPACRLFISAGVKS